jgi:hypothetical protein
MKVFQDGDMCFSFFFLLEFFRLLGGGANGSGRFVMMFCPHESRFLQGLGARGDVW